MPEKLSVLIPTLNEEENIAECIASLDALAEEIVVLDSYSADRTVEIARSCGAVVHQRRFDNFAAQKNAGLDLLSYDWVLIVDADERLTNALRAEIRGHLDGVPGKDGYRIPRETYFAGRRVRCWSGGSVLRLFRKSKSRYAADKKVHEELEVRGTTGELGHPLLHYTFRTFEQYLPKVHSFARLAAEDAHARGEHTSRGALIFLPFFRFFRTYILKGGVLDGIPGILIAGLAAYSTYLRYAILWELQQNRN